MHVREPEADADEPADCETDDAIVAMRGGEIEVCGPNSQTNSSRTRHRDQESLYPAMFTVKPSERSAKIAESEIEWLRTRDLLQEELKSNGWSKKGVPP